MKKSSMKKSMVVTTVLMVLLLVVALSTATFAWYTAQSNVAVNETLVTSATSSSAALVIDEAKATGNGTQSEVTITMTSQIAPAMLDMAADPVVRTTTLNDFKFKTYTVTNAGTYATTPSVTTVSGIETVKGSSATAQTQTSFYVTNIAGVATGVDAKITINPNYYVQKTVADGVDVSNLYTKNATTNAYEAATGNAVSGTTYYELKANNFLRVAMFVDNIYVGVWALDTTNANVNRHDFSTESAVVGGTPATHASFVATKTSGVATNVKANLASMAGIEVELLAWFEGDSHNNAYSGTGALFSISFSGVDPA